jgi:uncharacterized protein (AIM24 family)
MPHFSPARAKDIHERFGWRVGDRVQRCGVDVPVFLFKMMKSSAGEKEKEPDVVLHHTGWEKLQVPSPDAANFAIVGHESQVLTVRLPAAGDTVRGEPGTMMFLSPGVRQHVSYEGCCARTCSGEACFALNFTNSGSHSAEAAFAALAPNFPTAKVVPVELSQPHVNGKLICQQGAFMASYGDVRIGVSLDWNFMRCCCAGLGLVRQKLEGSGTAFLASTGTMVQKVLQPGETILVDTNCVMAFADSCKLDLRRAGGVLGMAGGGEGIFNTTLTGPGLVILQSMNETIFREALVAPKIYRR